MKDTYPDPSHGCQDVQPALGTHNVQSAYKLKEEEKVDIF